MGLVSVPLLAGTEAVAVAFESSWPLAADQGDSCLALSLLPAMLAGRRLDVERPVSRRLLDACPVLQRVFRRFFEWRAQWRGERKGQSISEIEVVAPLRTSGSPRPGVGLFFTGGLDSLATLIERRDEVTHLVYVEGYDIAAGNEHVTSRTLEALDATARAFDKELVVVRSDLRRLGRQLPVWELYHGPALAAAGLLLAQTVGRLYLSATKSVENLRPLGSHPVLDPLWSTEELDFVHAGCELGRVEKARLLRGCEPALRFLRTCWRNYEGRYNCQRCEKCLRTMVNLELAGVERCDSFPEPLDLSLVERLKPDEKTLDFWWENLLEARRGGARPELVRALERTVGDTPGRRAAAAVQRLIRRLVKKLQRGG